MPRRAATPAPTAPVGARGGGIARYMLIGFFTAAPLWVTWLVFDFLLGVLARVGRPLLRAAAGLITPFSSALSDWLQHPGLQTALAILLTLLVLYLVGLLASLVLGRRLIAAMEAMLGRLPLVQTIYGGTKRFLHSLRSSPVSGQRVVLIRFPTPEMKALGFITKVMRDARSGRELAAVYVPTSPNPTSGYIEIVPLDQVVHTDWTVEQAMSFVMTGGANAPDQVHYESSDTLGARS